MISHGTLAKGVYEAAKMICGELTNVKCICLEENMGIEEYRKNLSNSIDAISKSEQIVILADLKGGSPYNSVINILSQKGFLEKSIILSGLNLPMLLNLAFIEGNITKDDIEETISMARKGIINFEIQEDRDDII